MLFSKLNRGNMKKILLLTAICALSAQIGHTYPAVDFTAGGAQLRMIQQQNFQKNEYYDYKMFKDAQDRPIVKRTDSPKDMQAEFEIKNLKKPAKIQIGQPLEPASDMQLIQENGKIKIKNIDD